MSEHATPIAIVGLGAILPDAPDVTAFWHNLEAGRYSITDVRPDRWDPELYFDADHDAPDRTYSKIGGWVREWAWEPLQWHLPIPPRIGEAMDDAQKWAVACTRAALVDHGWPERPIDGERTAVILGNAMAGENHYRTGLRVAFPELARQLESTPAFAGLPAAVRNAIAREFHDRIDAITPRITEDTMPGELSNCIAGRVANLFDLHGPNFVVDAACASAMAAFDASIAGLAAGEFDMAISGGIDRNMGASTFVKFCKIGALSATGTRPFDADADGFVMGEGAAVFVLKRLADAERAGDRIYAVVRGISAASDGRGKGITAPNPVGQRLAIERAWRNAGLSPAHCSLVEAHGTSTRVGDVVEMTSLTDVFAAAGVTPGSVPLGSVKSNIGHLKSAAGGAGLLKATLALHRRQIPPSLGFEHPNPNIDWETSPFYVNTELAEWKVPTDEVRCAAVSAFGFGGTNFHAVLEEYVPGHVSEDRPRTFAVGADLSPKHATEPVTVTAKAPQRGAVVLGADTEAELSSQLREVHAMASEGRVPAAEAPAPATLAAPERIAIDFADAADLATKTEKALDAMTSGAAAWKMLQGRGVFRGRGTAGKVAFLYTGQGSQYVNMTAELRARERVIAETFAEADEVMTPLLGRPLTDIIFVDPASPEHVAAAEEELRRTEITQPAVLTVDVALTRLLAEYGIAPDMVMGHSLGEYAALVAAGALSFPAALEAVSARGHEMASLKIDDPGLMVAVMGPLETVEEIVSSITGNVVIANVNSTTQSVIGGASEAVIAAERLCNERGLTTARLPVSHAFHTSIVAPVSDPLRRTLERLDLKPPVLPIISNVTGDFYPMGPAVTPQMLDLLARQVASPVQFVTGLRRLADAGATVFVEVGPKWALRGFVTDVLASRPDQREIVNLATNHPKPGDIVSFNQALCGLYAASLGNGQPAEPVVAAAPVAEPTPQLPSRQEAAVSPSEQTYLELGRLFADFLDRGRAIYANTHPTAQAEPVAERRQPVVITGAALGTPGTSHVFDDGNLGLLLDGHQFIDVIPTQIRNEMLEHRITRLVKGTDGASWHTIDSEDDVLKLAARAGDFDICAEFGIDAERAAAYGRTTQLAIAVGIDALRDAGIPLVMRYKTTHIGTQLPERWGLPDELRDDTGVIFASAFPGIEEFAAETRAFATDRTRRDERSELQSIRTRLTDIDGNDVAIAEIDRRLHDLDKLIEDDPYRFERRFLLRVLSMGHSQFADVIGARGPNTQINAACASTTQAVGIAEDWIRAGRCRRVVIIAADDVTSDEMLGWFGSGFLATGAAATDQDVADAALPFDRRRHGMIIGMGAAALVVEAADAAHERGLQPICEVLSTVTGNSAFHGTRLDVDHIGDVMEHLVAQAEDRSGIDRHVIAPSTVFVSHETYTPARGGSASAEIFALRRVFGDDADRVVIANTKGFTGHPMAVGIEDVVAVKALETGIVPPVANILEPDPELGPLNLSKGGTYPIDYALRLAAGFGSQISMTLLRRTPPADGRRRPVDELGYGYRITDPTRFDAWLRRINGGAAAELEVVQRRLRVATNGRTETAAVAVVDEPAPAPVPAIVEVPPVEPEPAPVVAEPTVTAPSADAILEHIVALVAEQTGYPADMLAPDLDMEADLGIDTVKQAELFAAIRDTYQIPRDDKLQLRDYPTINHVVTFVHDRARPAASAVEAETPAASVTQVEEEIAGFPRRVPIAVLRPRLEQCTATGVELADGSRVVVLADAGGVATALAERLHSMGVETLVIDDAPTATTLVDRLASWRQASPITGLYALQALDAEAPYDQLDLDSWRDGLRRRVKLLANAMRELYQDIAASGTFLVSATRLGGLHGYGDAGATAPMGGAITGFTKAYSRERPDALVKAVDFAADDATATIVQHLVDETLHDASDVEVGRFGGDRWGIALAEESIGRASPERSLTTSSVFVITGAAGSIVSAITTDLAACGGTFHLLDLIDEPDPADSDLQRFVTDRDGLKRDIAARIAASGERATPALVERALARLERAKAAADSITAIRRAGGTVTWHSVDLTDPAAVDAVMLRVRQAHPRVDVLLHCAGVEISHSLDEKPEREFDLVFDVKVDGWFNLLHGLGDTALGTAAVFSSIAGRFGNGGQTDYSAANDLLCKSISSLRTTRPDTIGIAVDWTAWAGIGMASRGSIPKMMALAGIDMLPPEAGIAALRRELIAAAPAREVVVAGSLGMMAAVKEAHPTIEGSGPMVGSSAAWTSADGLTVTTLLDPARQAFLDHHRIDGTPVLPGVMGIEGFAEVAGAAADQWTVVGIDDVAFEAPCKFFRDEPRAIELVARPRLAGAELVAECRLQARRTLLSQPEQLTTHFTGRVRLAHTELAPQRIEVVDHHPTEVVGPADIYRIYFHGPAYRVLDSVWRDGDQVIGLMADDLPPDHQPSDAPLLLEPRLIELCFQTAGILELGTTGRLALPAKVGQIRALPVAEPVGRWRAIVTPRADQHGVDAVVVDERGQVRITLQAYETIGLPVTVDEDALEPLRRAMR